MKLTVTLLSLIIVPPVLAQSMLPEPPVALTNWFLFIVSLGSVLGLCNIVLVRFVLKPVITTELNKLPSRKEFDDHVQDDKEARQRIEDFIQNYYEFNSDEHRHRTRRKGDPQ